MLYLNGERFPEPEDTERDNALRILSEVKEYEQQHTYITIRTDPKTLILRRCKS